MKLGRREARQIEKHRQTAEVARISARTARAVGELVDARVFERSADEHDYAAKLIEREAEMRRG